jgi:hypothetical protein
MHRRAVQIVWLTGGKQRARPARGKLRQFAG